MAWGAIHLELGVELNATLADLGQPNHPGLWEALIAERPTQPGVLECPYPHDCTRSMLPVTASASQPRHFRHFGVADFRRAASAKGPEHDARQEYICNRVEREGLPAQTEYTIGNGKRRLDVYVAGPISVACEIQTSYIHGSTVVRRVGIDTLNGLTPLWIANDPYSNAINRAPWSRVPKSTPHRIAAGLDDLLQGGVMTAIREPCGYRTPSCPETGRKPCGQTHFYFDPALGVHLDGLVIGVAIGAYLPTTRKVERSTHHMWLTRDDYERYHQETPVVVDDSLEPDLEVVAEAHPQEIEDHCRYREPSDFCAEPSSPRDTSTALYVPNSDFEQTTFTEISTTTVVSRRWTTPAQSKTINGYSPTSWTDRCACNHIAGKHDTRNGYNLTGRCFLCDCRAFMGAAT